MHSLSGGRDMKILSRRLSILIADDHKLVAEVVGDYLTGTELFSVETAETYQEVLDKVALRSAFDIILLDRNMPGLHGLEEVRAVINANHPAPVALFTSSVDRYMLMQSLEHGLKGLIPKTMPSKSLVSALNYISSGEVFLPNAVVKSITYADQNPHGLTDSEVYILRLAAKGMTNKAIAHDMNQSETSIKMNMRSICIKLNASNRAHAAIIGTDLGIIN